MPGWGPYRRLMTDFTTIGAEYIVEPITSQDGSAKKINVGPIIRKYRKSLGWSQKYLAEESGLSREYVNMLEHGKRTTSLDTLQKIASAFGKDASDLLAAMGEEKEKLELAVLLTEIAESGDMEYLREVVTFAQQIAAKKQEQLS